MGLPGRQVESVRINLDWLLEIHGPERKMQMLNYEL